MFIMQAYQVRQWMRMLVDDDIQARRHDARAWLAPDPSG
jgi:hypothetical protein